MQGNYIDLVIILILLFFVLESFRYGFWMLLADFLSFLGTIFLSLWLYKYVALLLRTHFSLGHSASNAVGFLIVIVVSETILNYSLSALVKTIPEKLRKHKLNKLLGIFPALGEGLIITAFILTLAVAMPIRPSIKTDIVKSRLGGEVLKKTSGIEKNINEIFGGVIEDALTYLTVKPGSSEKIAIETASNNLSVDEKSEAEILLLINKERTKLGISSLGSDSKIVTVARNYATYLWENHYFGHYSLDGKDVGDRLSSAGITYTAAGENLALAPTVITAHDGLMNSDGHRANILDSDFHKVGVGVIDNGIYGKIFVQVFTD